MTDRIHPSSANPPANGTTAPAPAPANPSFPATKAQLYGATRPAAYRPQSKRHRHSRSCCCSFCIWLTLTLVLLILLAAIAGGILYALYRPHRPSFSVASLKTQTLNVTSSQTLIANFNLTVNTRNPNKELVFYYDPITVSLITNDDGNINVGVGSFPSFKHGTKNTTVLKSAIKSNAKQQLDDASASKVKTQLKRKTGGLPLKVRFETKVKVKMGAVKTPKLRIRVTCEGITVSAPTGKTASLASTSNSKCKVDWRLKIWKWTF